MKIELSAEIKQSTSNKLFVVSGFSVYRWPTVTSICLTVGGYGVVAVRCNRMHFNRLAAER